MSYEEDDKRKHGHDASTPHAAPAHVTEDGTPLSIDELQTQVIERAMLREQSRNEPESEKK